MSEDLILRLLEQQSKILDYLVEQSKPSKPAPTPSNEMSSMAALMMYKHLKEKEAAAERAKNEKVFSDRKGPKYGGSRHSLNFNDYGYKVIQGALGNLGEFNDRIAEYLSNGWILYGEPKFIHIGNCGYVHQTVIKHRYGLEHTMFTGVPTVDVEHFGE